MPPIDPRPASPSRWLWRALAAALLLLAPLAARADRWLDQRAFERAVILYGGLSQENLVGNACSYHGAERAPFFGSGERNVAAQCRVKHADRLDQPLERWPVVFQYSRSHRYYGRDPQRPEDGRGVYLYRFDAGKLQQRGDGVFSLAPRAAGRPLAVRAGDVVVWSAIVSNLENDAPHDTIAFQEVLVTPNGTRIHHCLTQALNGCDPLNPKAAQFGLCDGRVKAYDGKGAQSHTSARHFTPMTDSGCQAMAVIDDGDVRRTVFRRFQAMPQGEASIRSLGNQWVVEDQDPPGAYRIEVRLSGRLVGALDFEVTR